MDRSIQVGGPELERAIGQARRYVRDLGEDLVDREPDDRELTDAIMAVARYQIESLLSDLRWHLDDTRTGAYERFERALLAAMGAAG